MPAKNKIIKQLLTALLVRDATGGGIGTTTIGAAGAAAGQKVVPCAATANFTVGDPVRIGSGDEMELGAVASIQAGVSLTMAEELAYAHVAGEPVVEQVAYDLGDVTDGGVSVEGSGQTTDVQVSTRRLVYTVLNGYTSLSASFALPGLTLHNLALAAGIPLANISGDGQALTPFSLATDGSDFGGETNMSLIAIGLTQDGSPIRVELWGVDADYTAVSTQLKRGQLASVPMKFVASSGGAASTNASSYVANTSIRPTKGKVFDALQEVGFFTDATTGPLATTTTAAAAKGATVLALTAVTSLANGDWLKVGTGDLVEYHQIANIAALNVTLKSNLLRAQASGVAVVRQAQVSFGGIHEDGVQLAFGGSVEEVRLATKRMSAGIKLGAANVSLGFGIVEWSLSVLARVFGIPQTAIVNGRLPINSNIGSAVIDGMYVKGVLKDGTIAYVNAWGCSQDVSQIAAQITQQGVPSLPVRLKPASGIHFQQG